MGAPFRALCPGEGLERDLTWLAALASKQAVEVAKLFAHIGLKTIDEVAGERHGRTHTDYKKKRQALFHYQCPKPKCRCSVHVSASPRV